MIAMTDSVELERCMRALPEAGLVALWAEVYNAALMVPGRFVATGNVAALAPA